MEINIKPNTWLILGFKSKDSKKNRDNYFATTFLFLYDRFLSCTEIYTYIPSLLIEL